MTDDSRHSWYARLGSRLTGHSLDTPKPRPPFYAEDAHPWHIEMIENDCDGGDHPAWTSAVFTVHGIGTQMQTETAATLRSGFDDALGLIREYQEKHSIVDLKCQPREDQEVPPPDVADGWWANYEDVAETFENEFESFRPKQKEFFQRLWKQRTEDALGTFFWFVRQQLRLLSLRTFWEVGPLSWILYLPLQPVALAILSWMYIWKRQLITGFLEDVRLYADPRGVTERAIVQRIDARVAEKFMQMIGLTPDFESLEDDDCLKASNIPLRFNRVVWVAHSLGTVVSYNVLADLFRLAGELSENGTPEQKLNVQHFRKALRRFVTLGSPLDKFSFLFRGSLRAWPEVDRESLVEGGDRSPHDVDSADSRSRRDWWVNFFHVFDPVSRSLSTAPMRNPADGRPPVNIHMGRLFRIPGAAHMDYWKSPDVLRYVLSRTYGKAYLQDEPLRPSSAAANVFKLLIAYPVWGAILLGAILGLYRLIPWLWTGALGAIGAALGTG